jgi:hypothetical protein
MRAPAEAHMAKYEGALVSIVEMLEELIRGGETPDRAGHELGNAITDGAILLFRPDGAAILDLDELDRVANHVEQVVALYGAMLRRVRVTPSQLVWLQYLKGIKVLRPQFEIAFGIVSEEVQAPSSSIPSKRGAKPKHHWDLIETEGRRLMDHHGDFDIGDPVWNVQARLEEALLKFCREKWNNEPAVSSLRIKIAEWLPDWRRNKRSDGGA